MAESEQQTKAAGQTGAGQDSTPADKPSKLIAFLPVAPKLGWLIFAICAFIALYPGIHDAFPRLLERVHSVKLPGDIEFAFQELGESAEHASSETAAMLTGSELSSLQKRATLLLPALQGVRILWLDSYPDGNRVEVKLFTALGLKVDYVNSFEDAYAHLRRGQYGILITSIRVPDPSSTTGSNICGGQEFLDTVCRVPYASSRAPAIIYSYGFSQAEGVPPSVYGVARSRAQLVQLVLDIVERGFPQAECAKRSNDADPELKPTNCPARKTGTAAPGAKSKAAASRGRN
ncbi:hypothetical protein [Paraburkholderia bryophila]|uniref:Uncharacterized protein n=1 Tax=Paraburkholderia bryophila TaxID=420952 RepID=A0A7Z0B999_9BURK|nr:hypothetical protein [Paraburkholderia bryophila]NYH24217.1 hypothetical protein [Paraburkholderia bryophila]